MCSKVSRYTVNIQDIYGSTTRRPRPDTLNRAPDVRVVHALDLASVVELQRVEAARHRVDDEPHRIRALAHLSQAELDDLVLVRARRDAHEELVARGHLLRGSGSGFG